MLSRAERQLRRALRAQLRHARKRPIDSLRILAAPTVPGWELLTPAQQDEWNSLRRQGSLLTWRERYESSYKPTLDGLRKQFIQASASEQWAMAAQAAEAIFRTCLTLQCNAPPEVSAAALAELGMTWEELKDLRLQTKQRVAAPS